MAKGLLRFFGGASVLLGFVALGWGFAHNGNLIAMSWGGGMLLAGAPLLGFAQVITLLEQIARNTRMGPTPDQPEHPVDPAVAEFFRRREGR